jgi:hypothetical protein
MNKFLVLLVTVFIYAGTIYEDVDFRKTTQDDSVKI